MVDMTVVGAIVLPRMSAGYTKIVERLAAVIVIGAIAVYWTCRQYAQSAHSEMVSALHEHPLGFPYAGYQPQLKTVTSDKRIADVIAAHRNTLLFVVSDECPICRSRVGEWQNLVEELPRDKAVAIVLLSLSGAKITGTMQVSARRAGVDVTVGSVASARAFGSEAAVRGVPTVLLLGSDGRIKLDLIDTGKWQRSVLLESLQH
jgi:hypothetical protein